MPWRRRHEVKTTHDNDLWIPKNPSGLKMLVLATVREIIIVSTMSPFFIALLALVTFTFRIRAAQQAEIVALRHQIAVLQQSAPRRLRLRQSDRLFVSFRPLIGQS